MSKTTKLFISRFFSLVIILSSVLGTTAQAQIISAPDLQNQYNKQELLTTFAREDVQKKLVALGVDTDVVNERINNLTNEEIASLNDSIDNMPVGSGILSLAVTIFIVLIITDMIGATDVFNFVKKV
jgi:hypothetical protein